MGRKDGDSLLRCGFCNKHQNEVGKLISSPLDDPTVYICDECVAVCHSILDDERLETAIGRRGDPETVLSLLDAIERWFRRDLAGDAAAELEVVRTIAARIFLPSSSR